LAKCDFTQTYVNALNVVKKFLEPPNLVVWHNSESQTCGKWWLYYFSL